MPTIRVFSKWAVAAGLCLLLVAGLSSCGHKDGCPNKITEVGGVKLETTT